MKPRSLILSTVIGLIALAPPTASAHPTLVRSSPTGGAKAKSLEVVSLWFSEKIEPVFNKVEVVDGAGTHMENGKAVVDATDRTLVIVRVKQLPVGSYSVRWRVSAADSHKMEGSFGFQVVP